MLTIGFLASHDGSAMRAVVEAARERRLDASAGVVISNNSGSGALAWARAAGLEALHVSARTHDDPDAAICGALEGCEVVVLSGYMKRLGPRTLESFRGRILNVHPSLLPAFGGQGMYGLRVHEAMLRAGVAVTGATIHVVDGDYDQGPVVAQAEVPVVAGDDAETLARRVQARERTLFVEVLGAIASGRMALPVS